MKKRKNTNPLPPDTIVVWKRCWIGRVLDSRFAQRPLAKNKVRVRRLENARATYLMDLADLQIVQTDKTQEELVKLIKAMNRVGANGVQALVRELIGTCALASISSEKNFMVDRE